MEGNVCFQTDWASLIVARKFTIFVLFYFHCNLRVIFQVQAPGCLYLETFLCYCFGGFIH